MQWTCETCTFAGNEDEAPVCSICMSERALVLESGGSWRCTQCTFMNNTPIGSPCEICYEICLVQRSPSETIATDFSISREIARRAITAAGGSIQAAAANLLLGVYPHVPSFPIQDLSSPSSSLRSHCGISQSMARQLLNECGNDLNLAKEKLLEQFNSYSTSRFQRPTSDLETGPAEEREEKDVTVSCPICADDFSSSSLTLMTLSCGHTYCRFCLTGHIDARIDAGDSSVILCPEANLPRAQGGCGSGLLQRELRMAIGDKRYSVLDRRALEQAVAVDPTLHLCASPDCPFVTSWSGPEDGAPVMDCLVCHHRRCMVCGADPYHDGTGCPVPAEEEEDASMQFIANSNIRRCKRCNNGIIKEVGCDKVKCRCGYRFCWICGSENAQCGCTPSNHGFIDNVTGRGDFTNLKNARSPT